MSQELVLAAKQAQLDKPLNPRQFRMKLAKDTKLKHTNIQVTTVHIQDDYWGVQVFALYGSEDVDNAAMLVLEEQAWGPTGNHALGNVYKTIRDMAVEDIRAFDAGEEDTFGKENSVIEDAEQTHGIIDAIYTEVEENDDEPTKEPAEEPHREGPGSQPSFPREG